MLFSCEHRTYNETSWFAVRLKFMVQQAEAVKVLEATVT